MRGKIKIFLIFLAVLLLAELLGRSGFFNEPNNNRRIVDVLFPAPVRFNLIILACSGMLFMIWIIWKGVFKQRH